jgi:hypothetical protein
MSARNEPSHAQLPVWLSPVDVSLGGCVCQRVHYMWCINGVHSVIRPDKESEFLDAYMGRGGVHFFFLLHTCDIPTAERNEYNQVQVLV